MARTGRYIYCPAAGRIRGNRRTLREWLSFRFKKREVPDLYMFGDYYPAYYPGGYKK